MKTLMAVVGNLSQSLHQVELQKGTHITSLWVFIGIGDLLKIILKRCWQQERYINQNLVRFQGKKDILMKVLEFPSKISGMISPQFKVKLLNM